MSNASPNARSILASLLLVVGLAATTGGPSFAQGASGGGSGPFKAFLGVWSGSGAISFSDGHKERIRCRATYAPQAGDRLESDIRCASDSYNFDLSADVTAVGNHLSGSWKEATRGVQGRLNGSIHGRRMALMVQGQAFGAGLGLAANGGEQTIHIESRGTDFTSVSITLRNMR